MKIFYRFRLFRFIDTFLHDDISYEFDGDRISKWKSLGSRCGCGKVLKTRKEEKKHEEEYPNYSCFDHTK